MYYHGWSLTHWCSVGGVPLYVYMGTHGLLAVNTGHCNLHVPPLLGALSSFPVREGAT